MSAPRELIGKSASFNCGPSERMPCEVPKSKSCALTVSLPPSISGPSGLNAIAHCVEALYSNARNAQHRFARRFQVLEYHKVSTDPHPFFAPVHPAVFEAVNKARGDKAYDPEKWSGYAFGLGMDRLAMILFDIPYHTSYQY